MKILNKENNKMELTSKKQKARIYQVYNYLKLKYPEWATREEISAATGICDRTVRDCIAKMRYKIPVCSFATQKGYRLALTENDMADVEHTLAEMESRRKELALTERPLIIFKKYGKVMPIKSATLNEED